jgi:hypothetical protein
MPPALIGCSGDMMDVTSSVGGKRERVDRAEIQRSGRSMRVPLLNVPNLR